MAVGHEQAAVGLPTGVCVTVMGHCSALIVAGRTALAAGQVLEQEAAQVLLLPEQQSLPAQKRTL
jgi:hypothetical protein